MAILPFRNLTSSTKVICAISLILVVHLIVEKWENTNEDRIRTFTVRSEHDTGWMDIIAPLVMPVCQLYDLLMYGKMKVELMLESGRSNHEAEVVKVQEQVKMWNKEDGGRKMCTARPQWMSISPQSFQYKDKMFRVRLNLDKIVGIDKKKMVVKVEPSISIGLLNRALVE